MLLFHGALLGDGCVWSPPVYRDLSPSSYLGRNRKNLIGELRKYISDYDKRHDKSLEPTESTAGIKIFGRTNQVTDFRRCSSILYSPPGVQEFMSFPVGFA
jgi:hypothetical protein